MEKYNDDIGTRFEFWRFLRIPEANFVEETEVGDLILCMTKKKLKLGGVQPDRIGILVKMNAQNNDKPELFVLKAGDSFQRPIVF